MALRYAIVGAGAVGGYFGGRLFSLGREVHFLYRSEYQAVREKGLRLSGPGESQVTLSVSAYQDARDIPEVDVILVTLKATQQEALEEILPAILARSPSATVTCLQNGLGNEDAIARLVGKERVLAGAAFIGAERGAPGEVILHSEGRLALGPYFEAGKEKIVRTATAMAADFEAAGVPCPVKASGRDVKWGKLIWNTPYSGGAIYYGAVACDQIAGNPERETFARAVMEEIIEAAARDGAQVDPALVAWNIAHTRTVGAYKPSLLVDYEKGRPMEIEGIVAEPLRRGLAAGLPMPAMMELLRGIRAFLAGKEG